MAIPPSRSIHVKNRDNKFMITSNENNMKSNILLLLQKQENTITLQTNYSLIHQTNLKLGKEPML